MTGADHNAQACALRARKVGHAGCGQGPEQHDIHASRVEARFQRRFKHVTRDARVLADEDGWVILTLLEHTAYGVSEAQYKIWSDGRLAHRAANTVSTEIFTRHFY